MAKVSGRVTVPEKVIYQLAQAPLYQLPSGPEIPRYIPTVQIDSSYVNNQFYSCHYGLVLSVQLGGPCMLHWWHSIGELTKRSSNHSIDGPTRATNGS